MDKLWHHTEVPPIATPAKVLFEVVVVRYPILSAPLTRIQGLLYLLLRIDNKREFVLVDSGAACHVCPPDWAARMSSWNKLSTSTVEKGSEALAPIAEDARDLGPQPVRQDAPLAEPMRKPNCPTPEEIARHELTHLPAARRV